MPWLGAKPSISTSSWFSVCSRSSWLSELLAAAPADRVELVDEDDARVVAPRILEQLADARRADAGVHLDEIRAAGKQKRHLRFAGHRARQQRLAGSRRSDEQNAFRNASADGRKARRLAQELDDLLHFLFRLVDARDVGEGHGRLHGIRRACLAFESRDAPGRDAIQGHAEHADEADAQDERAVAERVLFGRGANVDADVPPRQIGDEAGIQRDVVGRRVGPERLARGALERRACRR